jgi:hypothetical protein
MKLKPPTIFAMANSINYRKFDTPKGKRKFQKFLDEAKAGGWAMLESSEGRVFFQPIPEDTAPSEEGSPKVFEDILRIGIDQVHEHTVEYIELSSESLLDLVKRFLGVSLGFDTNVSVECTQDQIVIRRLKET